MLLYLSRCSSVPVRAYASGTITGILVVDENTPLSMTTSDNVLIERRLDTEQDAPAAQIVELVAILEDRDQQELPPIYYSIDELLADLFSSPPTPDSKAALEFTYEGYQFRVQQDGTTTVANRTASTPG